MSTFDVVRVDSDLARTIFAGKLHHFTTIGSTNTRALADAQAGAGAGQVYIADEQTAGRGRGGHAWRSEPDCGLYMTALLRPDLRGTGVLALSLLAGIAAHHAIHEVTGLSIDLRWPNDLVSPPAFGPVRKLGGILTEAVSSPDGKVRYAVIGIGINLNQTSFSPDLQAIATSLRLLAGAPISREHVAAALLVQLHLELVELETSGTADGIFVRFAAVSSWVSGKHVRVDEDGGYTGLTAGLTPAGLLRVRCDDGCERVVRHGGVREV